MAPPGVDRRALGDLLEASGLLEPGLGQELARHAGRFPAVTARNMFLEFELTDRPAAAGFGLGFPVGLLDRYTVRDHWFLSTRSGRALLEALAADPFARDHAAYLNLFSDADPDWVEFDVREGSLEPQPFVFFRFPSRFRFLETVEQARTLEALLPGTAALGSVLETLLAFGSVGMYRFGLARRRGAHWRRVVLDGLAEPQVQAALTTLGAADFQHPLALSRAFYQAPLEDGTRYALSVDFERDAVTAVDVEFPYLGRIADPPRRRERLAEFLAPLVPPPAAAWLQEYVQADFFSQDENRRLQVGAHHLKHRFFPHARTKVYLHLAMARRKRPC